MFVIDDGGHAAAGFKGGARDCVVRAVAIASGKPYASVYAEINALCAARGGSASSARKGVPRPAIRVYMENLGAKWTPTMRPGSGCKIHLCAEELPKGRLVVSVSRHLVAVIDGVIHDTHDPTRDGKRCVYGYWSFE